MTENQLAEDDYDIIKHMIDDLNSLSDQYCYSFDDAPDKAKLSDDIFNITKYQLDNAGFTHLVPTICICADKNPLKGVMNFKINIAANDEKYFDEFNRFTEQMHQSECVFEE